MKSIATPPPPEQLQQFSFLQLRDSIRDLHRRFSESELAKRISDEQVEVIYSVGHGLFLQGKFDNALNVFKMIMLYRPFDARNMEAYATTLKRMGRFEEAIPIYSAALLYSELADPMPSLHIAECLAALGRSEESARMLRPILDLADVDAAYGEIRERADNLLSMLRKES